MDGHRTRYDFRFRGTISTPGTDAHHSKDRFETLCHVVADIPASSYNRKPGITGKMCSIYKFDVVLVVGLTELKAQIRWLDSETVRVHD